ncbi:MAG: hypothetical protein EHM93_16730 [Bacteroidales bacterium]|nr:MAG: hypothetical protein EHM93_16730 [Bacteroidales bacterium]
MRKLILGFAMLLMSQLGFGQAVSDNAVVPVSVTLNSILRLTVVSGGNIQFVVNNIGDYTSGVANTTQYRTTFTVASSRDFDVDVYAEDLDFIGTDAGGSLLLENVGYVVWDNIAAAQLVALDVLTDNSAPVRIIDEGAAGDATDNEFQLRWELGTPALQVLSTLGSLLSQSIAPDNYVNNVFIVLSVD